jgi:integrase
VANLTMNFIRSQRAPEQSQKLYFDDRTPGLALRVMHSGVLSFVFEYRSPVTKKMRRLTICSWGKMPLPTVFDPPMPLDEIRKEAGKLRAQIDDDIDPLEPVEDDESDLTLKGLSEKFLDHAENHLRLRKGTMAGYRALLRSTLLPRFGKTPIRTLSMGEIQKMHWKLKATPYLANRAVTLLNRMYTFAISKGWTDENPALNSNRIVEGKIRRYDEEPHKVPYTEEQWHQLERALGKSGGAQAIRLLMLTGSRVNEVLKSTWGEFDLHRGLWTKPGHAVKNRKEHTIPLNDKALALLKQLHKTRKSQTYVFPSPADPKQPRASLQVIWRLSLKRAGLTVEDAITGKHRGLWRLHDLRHIYGSMLVSHGANLPTVGKLLGHRTPTTTMRYATPDENAMREATAVVSAIYAKKR